MQNLAQLLGSNATEASSRERSLLGRFRKATSKNSDARYAHQTENRTSFCSAENQHVRFLG